MASALARCEDPQSPTRIAVAIREAAKRLGNTPAICRKSYVHPRVIDLSLGRMTRLLDALGNPERSLPPVIHVAGTNGKAIQGATGPVAGRAHLPSEARIEST